MTPPTGLLVILTALASFLIGMSSRKCIYEAPTIQSEVEFIAVRSVTPTPLHTLTPSPTPTPIPIPLPAFIQVPTPTPPDPFWSTIAEARALSIKFVAQWTTELDPTRKLWAPRLQENFCLVVILAPSPRMLFRQISPSQRFIGFLNVVEKFYNNVMIPYGLDRYHLAVFHEDYTEEDMAAVRSKAGHANVLFQRINLTATPLAYNINVVGLEQMEQLGQHGLRYFNMCRFFGGGLFIEWASLVLQYKYVMRLDSDAFWYRKPEADPVGLLHKQGLDYAYYEGGNWGQAFSALVQPLIQKGVIGAPTVDSVFVPNNHFEIVRTAAYLNPETPFLWFWTDLNKYWWSHGVTDSDVRIRTIDAANLTFASYFLEHSYCHSWKCLPFFPSLNLVLFPPELEKMKLSDSVAEPVPPPGDPFRPFQRD